MKKITLFSLVLIFLSAAVSAQGPGDRFRRNRASQGFSSGQTARPERAQLHKDLFRYKIADRKARRDGRVGPRERRKLHKMRSGTRHDRFRFRHHGRRRVI